MSVSTEPQGAIAAVGAGSGTKDCGDGEWDRGLWRSWGREWDKGMLGQGEGQRYVGTGSGTEGCGGREWDKGMLGQGVGQRYVGTGSGTEGCGGRDGTEGCGGREWDSGMLGQGVGTESGAGSVMEGCEGVGAGSRTEGCWDR